MFRKKIKYWKNRVASKIFNHLWNDPESGLRDMFERNIQARTTTAIMGWLDHKGIRHCKYCPIVDETPLKSKDGMYLCERHAQSVMSDKVGHA